VRNRPGKASIYVSINNPKDTLLKIRIGFGSFLGREYLDSRSNIVDVLPDVGRNVIPKA
jgi:hypothetical protein